MAARNRIQIQRAHQVRDNKGGFSKDWSDLLPNPIFAAIRHFGGAIRPVTSKGGEVPVAQVAFETRYVDGIVAGDRVLYQAKAYRITHVDNVEERNRFLILTCESGVAA